MGHDHRDPLPNHTTFDGSASTLVTHLLESSEPTREELDAIREAIETFESRNRKRGGRR